MVIVSAPAFNDAVASVNVSTCPDAVTLNVELFTFGVVPPAVIDGVVFATVHDAGKVMLIVSPIVNAPGNVKVSVKSPVLPTTGFALTTDAAAFAASVPAEFV